MKDLNVIVEDHRVCMLAVIVNRQRLKALQPFLGSYKHSTALQGCVGTCQSDLGAAFIETFKSTILTASLI